MRRVIVESLESRTLFAVPGTFDTSFSGDGRATLDFSKRGESATDVLVEPNGKVVIAGYSIVYGAPTGVDSDLFVARYNANGTPDTTFSGDGKQFIATAYQGKIDAIARQADGKIVAVGSYAQNVDEPRAFVMRLKTDGNLDTSFAGDGIEILPYDKNILDFNAVAIQSDGKIVAVGNSWTSMVVARFNTNGTLDTTFDGDGRRFVAIGTEDTYGLATVIQGDGKILIAGNCNDGGHNDIFVTRLKTSGATDFTFNGGIGAFRKDYGHSDNTGSMVLHTNGKIYLGGSVNWGQNMAVWRLTGEGKLDGSFSGDGMWVAGKGSVQDIVVQNTGKVVWVNDDFALGRLNANGTNDFSFEQHTLGIGSTDKWGWALAKSGEDKVVAAGEVEFGQHVYDAGVARYHAASKPDAPTMIFAKGYDPRTIQVKWQDNSANETWFNVQRSYDSSFTTGVVNYTYGANIQSASLTNLTPGVRYYVRVRATNAQGASAWSSWIGLKTPELPYTSRINAGGGAYTDALGRNYTADAGFTGTSDVVTTASYVGGTTDDELYYTRRWGKNFGFSQVVPNGTYTVQLGFYDPDKTAAGQRVFDVMAEGKTMIDNLDLVATAGYLQAHNRLFSVTVIDGKLDLSFTGVVGNATVSWISILPLG